jgi:hypothetical protein
MDDNLMIIGATALFAAALFLALLAGAAFLP